MNRALLAKNTWRFIQNSSSLASSWARNRYASVQGDFSFKSSSAASFIWKGIHKNGDLIMTMLKWRLSDGASIDIASRCWLIPWEGPKGIFCVADLWDKSGNCWNFALINGLYGNHDCSCLNFIHPSMFGLKDELVWNGHPSGTYTVSAGYKWLLERRTVSPSVSSGPSLLPWKDYWKYKLPARVLLFG